MIIWLGHIYMSSRMFLVYARLMVPLRVLFLVSARLNILLVASLACLRSLPTCWCVLESSVGLMCTALRYLGCIDGLSVGTGGPGLFFAMGTKLMSS